MKLLMKNTIVNVKAKTNLFDTYTDITYALVQIYTCTSALTHADLEPADFAISRLLCKTVTCFHQVSSLQIYTTNILPSQLSTLLLHQFLFPFILRVPMLEDGLWSWGGLQMRAEIKGGGWKCERERLKGSDEVRYGICVRLIMPVAVCSVPPDGHI